MNGSLPVTLLSTSTIFGFLRSSAASLIRAVILPIIEPLRIATLAEVQARSEAGEVLLGPEVTRWFAAGKTVIPHAATLARLAASRNDFVTGEKLAPIYLRETTFVKAPPLRVIV